MSAKRYLTLTIWFVGIGFFACAPTTPPNRCSFTVDVEALSSPNVEVLWFVEVHDGFDRRCSMSNGQLINEEGTEYFSCVHVLYPQRRYTPTHAHTFMSPWMHTDVLSTHQGRRYCEKLFRHSSVLVSASICYRYRSVLVSAYCIVLVQWLRHITLVDFSAFVRLHHLSRRYSCCQDTQTFPSFGCSTSCIPAQILQTLQESITDASGVNHVSGAGHISIAKWCWQF